MVHKVCTIDNNFGKLLFLIEDFLKTLTPDKKFYFNTTRNFVENIHGY